MDLVQQASDDQLALAICLAAVAGSGLVMYFSHFVGKLTAQARVTDATREPARRLSAEAMRRDKAA